MNIEDYINQRLEKIQKTADENEIVDNIIQYMDDNPRIAGALLGALAGSAGGSAIGGGKGAGYGAVLGGTGGALTGKMIDESNESTHEITKNPTSKEWRSMLGGAGVGAGAGALGTHLLHNLKNLKGVV